VCCGWRTPPTAHSNTRQIPDAVDRVVCAPDDGWKYHPKHLEQFPDINKQCNVASCWIYIGILLAHSILHISKIRVKDAEPPEPAYGKALANCGSSWQFSPCSHVLHVLSVGECNENEQ
jgi:hypothetical protein